MKKYNPLVISLIAVVSGILFAFIVVAVTGKSPFGLLSALVRTMTGFNLQKPEQGINMLFVLNWWKYAVPMILTGLSVAFAYRTGLFNIGGEGQIIAGGVAAAFVALCVDLPPIIHPIVCLLAAAIAGALWGFLPGILKAYRGINEVVICIMLNYSAMYLGNWLTRAFLPIDPNTNARTIAFPDSAILKQVTTATPSQFNWGFLTAIIGLILFWFIIEKTTFGYSLKATGFNKEAARYAGMKVEKNITLSMMISGAFCGVAGALFILGEYKYGRIYTTFDNFGFDGISVALVGASNAVGVFFSGLLFSLLKSASGNLQAFQIPKELSEIVQAIIIFLVAIQYGIILLLNKLNLERFFKKKDKDPNAIEGGGQA